MTRFAFSLILAVALAAPAIADDKADIEARLTEFETAVNAGDAAGVAALYTDDAMVVPPDAPTAEGREAIQALWQEIIDGGLKDVDLIAGEISPAGDTAYEVSTFEGTIAGEDGDTPAMGKYVVIWRKVDGDWLLHRDIWNLTPTGE